MKSNRIEFCCSANTPAAADGETIDSGAEKIARDARFESGKRNRCPAGADARILPFAADVVAAGARSGDAAFPSLAAQPRPDRTAMANPARARLARRRRGHGTRARCFPAGPEPFTDSARPGSASSDRTTDGESRSAPRRGVDLRQGFEA